MSRVISIRRFLLGAEQQNREQTLLRGLGLLLDGTTLHAVEGDHADHEAFVNELSELAARIGPDIPTDDILLVIGAALKCIENYNRRTGAFLRFQATELQSMVSMLTETVGLIAAGQERTVARLQDIEKQLEKAAAVEDIRLLKVRLADCLTSLREETTAQRQESAQIVDGLNEGIARVKATASSTSTLDTDAVTGLPARGPAESAMAEAIDEERRVFAAGFVVERLHSINARFGYAIGDRVMLAFKNWLLEWLSPGDTVFRWTGPAFLVLLERDAPIEFVCSEMARLCARKLELTIEIGARSLLLPVSAAWMIIPMEATARLVAHKVDSFVATHTGEKR